MNWVYNKNWKAELVSTSTGGNNILIKVWANVLMRTDKLKLTFEMQSSPPRPGLVNSIL